MILVSLLLLNWNLFHLVRENIQIQSSTAFCSLFKSNLHDETVIMLVYGDVCISVFAGQVYFFCVKLCSDKCNTYSMFEVSFVWTCLLCQCVDFLLSVKCLELCSRHNQLPQQLMQVQGSRLTFQLASPVASDRCDSLAKTNFSLARHLNIYYRIKSSKSQPVQLAVWTLDSQKVAVKTIHCKCIGNNVIIIITGVAQQQKLKFSLP